jgi:hypothetical protein
MKAVVVVPTSRELHIRAFLNAWKDEFSDATILVIGDERSYDVSGDNVIHYSREDINKTLGTDSWIIPSKTGCVRSFGCLMAHRMHPDMIVCLDDDCYPDPGYTGFLLRHWERLQSSSDPCWTSTADEFQPRGMPYYNVARTGPAILNHGLWNNIPDFDASTQLQHQRTPLSLAWSSRTVPRGHYFPMCSMNIAWRPALTPAMYFLLMGPSYSYDRFGDIWGGVLVKRVCDHLGLAVNTGEPAIEHQRASNVWTNLRKEATGLEVNERFWQEVDSVRLTESDVKSCYIELAQKLSLEGEYWDRLRDAMVTWARMF